MEIFGNMWVLPFLSCVLTSLRYQNGYYGCGGSRRYHYGRCAMLKLPLVAPKFRLRRVKKRGKKEQKMENCVFFCVFTSWTLFWGSIRIRKVVWGRCARQKIFLNFGNQLRCAISEISSYNIHYVFSNKYIVYIILYRIILALRKLRRYELVVYQIRIMYFKFSKKKIFLCFIVNFNYIVYTSYLQLDLHF